MPDIYLPQYGALNYHTEEGDLVFLPDGRKVYDLTNPGSLDCLYGTVLEDEFHIGDVSQARKHICKLCGGDKFQVGSDEYFTAIRCIRCKWEVCIHEG